MAGQRPQRPIRDFPAYFELLVEQALDGGTVYTTPERTAAALWLPADTTGQVPTIPDYQAKVAHVAGRWAPRFTAFDTVLDCHHITGTPHEYLAILAVHPSVQGQGIGTGLLRAHHGVLDNAGIPAYLEASSARNRALYLRHGYIPQPNAPCYLPSDGPALWPMWRPVPRHGR